MNAVAVQCTLFEKSPQKNWLVSPPEQDPPRLASLSVEQEGLIREMLEVLAFSNDSAYQAEACQVLEEWWIENPLYRDPFSHHDE